MNLDLLAEQMRRHSPYNFGFDNPVFFQDYDGVMPTGGTDPNKKAKAVAQKAETALIDGLESAGNTLVDRANSIADYKFGGYSLRSLFSSGGDQSTKREGTRETEVVDVTVIDVIIGLLSVGKDKVNNNKGTSNNTNKTKGLNDGKDLTTKSEGTRELIVAGKGLDTYDKMSNISNSSTMNAETTAGESGTGMVSVEVPYVSSVVEGDAYNKTRIDVDKKDTLVNSNDASNIVKLKEVND